MWKALEVLEKLIGHTGLTMGRTASFLYYFRIGKRYDYPTCCVTQFAWDACRRKPAAIRRGAIRQPGTSKHYVPCWYHKRGPFWKPFGPTQIAIQLRLFEETQNEAHVRRRCRRELERQFSGRGFGRAYRQSR